jgi:hypothetical protein
MQAITLQANGLNRLPNPLTAPSGSLIQADNVVIDKDNTIEQRRGFKRYGMPLSDMHRLFSYQSKLLVHYGSKIAKDSDGLGTWYDYFPGTYDPPIGSPRIRELETNKNFYFLTNAGVKKLDRTDAYSQIFQAGMPRGLDIYITDVGTPGFMPNNTQVAYRICWGITDSNNNKIIGSPSERGIFINTTGSSQRLGISSYIPDLTNMTFNHFYQIYRSEVTVGVGVVPSDEMQLVVEKKLTLTDLSNTFISYNDSLEEGLRGAYLYTNPSQEGILNANERPPIARDIALYKEMTLYANTISKHRLSFTISFIGGSNGLIDGDIITIGGRIYTGHTGSAPLEEDFLIVTAGTQSEQIEGTVIHLIGKINKNSNNTTIYAYYQSGYQDLVGQILIEERGIGGSQFYITSNRTTAFTPNFPSSGITYASDNDVAINRLYFSKISQPESVPLLQYIDVGSRNKNILRVIALRDSFFILKEDGIYRGTGTDPTNLSIMLFDSTTDLLAIDSAIAFNNQVYCYSTQGITAISDSGISIVSRPIESDLLKISSYLYTTFPSITSGLSYESDRKYILSTISDIIDNNSTEQFVYNSLTNTFTKWLLELNHAILFNGDNRIYYCSADPDIPYVMQERKSYTEYDYADDDLPVVITGQVGLMIRLLDSTNCQVGWTLSDGVRKSVITSILDGFYIIVKDYYTWNMAGATVYKPISCKVQYAPQHCGNPAMVKHFTDVLLHFREASFDELTLTFSTDISGFDELVTLTPNVQAKWGGFPWGSAPWGGRGMYLQTIRTFVPLNKSKGRWLNVGIQCNQALATFSLAGNDLNYEDVSLRSK